MEKIHDVSTRKGVYLKRASKTHWGPFDSRLSLSFREGCSLYQVFVETDGFTLQCETSTVRDARL